jgi:hypothetical protein
VVTRYGGGCSVFNVEYGGWDGNDHMGISRSAFMSVDDDENGLKGKKSTETSLLFNQKK